MDSNYIIFISCVALIMLSPIALTRLSDIFDKIDEGWVLVIYAFLILIIGGTGIYALTL